MRSTSHLAALALLLPLSACTPETAEPLLGTLEWDRISLPAEASEVILTWQVSDGDEVQAGQLLGELDPRRQEARIAQARGEVAQARARLTELSNGARLEAIEEARGSLARAQAEQREAASNHARVATLYARQQVAIAELDRARASRDQSLAATQSAAARLRELTNGTRPEQIEQAAAVLESARGRLAELRLGREHLSLRAPRDGRVDALPFKVGDQPPAGAELVSLLVGEQPYARVFVPASQRAALHVGQPMQVHVEGIAQPFSAQISSLRREASFTPYYALSGDDASQLVYRAELRLLDSAARQLPAGLPLQAEAVTDAGE